MDTNDIFAETTTPITPAAAAEPARTRVLPPAPESAYERLPLKRRKFVDAYLGVANGCKREAARLAGYQDPLHEGFRVLRDPHVRAVVDEFLRDFALSREEVLARLADQARGSIADFLDLHEDGTWTFNLRKAEQAGKLHLVSELDGTGAAPRLKLHDAQHALIQLGRFYGLFTDRVDARVRVSHEFDGWTDEELERYARGEDPQSLPASLPSGE